MNWALLPDSPWKIEPMQVDVVVEPGKTADLKFHLKYPANPFGPNPSPPPGYSFVLRSGVPRMPTPPMTGDAIRSSTCAASSSLTRGLMRPPSRHCGKG